MVDGGIDYLVSLGTTGETATLSKDEKKKVWDFTAEINNGRLPLVAGIGGNDTYVIGDAIKTFENNNYSAIPVSYPHLDVYKRQIQSC